MAFIKNDGSESFLTKKLSHILLEHDKTYKKYTENMNDGTYKAEMLKKSSELAKNSERYNDFTKRYARVGSFLLLFTCCHLLLFLIAFFQLAFVIYFFVLLGFLMDWYALYTKKTPFAYVAPVVIMIGIMIDILAGWITSMTLWAAMVFAYSVILIIVIHPLNKEYIYLSKQDGFPHFKHILDIEIEKNKKALEGKLDLYYANLTAPEGKLGDMDEIELPLESIEARPDGRNDYMDSV